MAASGAECGVEPRVPNSITELTSEPVLTFDKVHAIEKITFYVIFRKYEIAKIKCLHHFLLT